MPVRCGEEEGQSGMIADMDSGQNGEARHQRLLLIDTCGVEGTMALAEVEAPGSWEIVATRTMPGRTASEQVIPMLRAMLEEPGWRLDGLAAIAVVRGPGSFTGLRVGVSAAKGLCEATGVPLLGISRLAVLASMAGQGDRRVHSVLSAGRGEVFLGEYIDGGCEREELVTLDEAVERMAEAKGAVVVCDGLLEEPFRGAGVRRVPEPTAAGALPVATRQLQMGRFADVSSLDGHYLRRTEAEIRERVEAHRRARLRAVRG